MIVVVPTTVLYCLLLRAMSGHSGVSACERLDHLSGLQEVNFHGLAAGCLGLTPNCCHILIRAECLLTACYARALGGQKCAKVKRTMAPALRTTSKILPMRHGLCLLLAAS